MEEPAVPIRPVHHRRDRKTAIEVGHGPELIGAVWRYLTIRDGSEKAFDATATGRYRSRPEKKMQQEKERVALTSMAASAGLTIAKAIVGM
jgi:hypothetical protein